MINQIGADISNRFALTIDVRHHITRMTISENNNIRVADIACQLLLLTANYDIGLNETLSTLIAHYPKLPQDAVINYINNALDAINMDLMEHYPLINELIDQRYLFETGNVRILSKEEFLSKFTDIGHLEDHYNFIVMDSVLNRLLQRFPNVLAMALFTPEQYTIMIHDIQKLLYGFFKVIIEEIMTVLGSMDKYKINILPETSISVSGDVLLIHIEIMNYRNNHA